MAITWKKIAYEDDVLLKSVFNAQSLVIAVDDNTPIVLEVAASRIVGRAAAGNIVALAKADVLTLINVADGADVTGDNAPQAHKDSHDPEDGGDPLDCAAPAELASVQAANEGSSHSFARADHVHQIQHSIDDNHLVTVDDATPPSDGEVAVFTASGVEGQTPAEVAATMALDDVGVPDAAVDFDLQEATDLVVMTVANEAALPAANVAVGQLCWATGELSLHVCTAAA